MDIDGDGFPDLLNTCYTADLFLNRGGRTFQKIYSFSSNLNMWTSVAADMNGDGKPDIVSVAGNPQGLAVFLYQISPWKLCRLQPASCLAQIVFKPLPVSSPGWMGHNARHQSVESDRKLIYVRV